MRKAIQVKQKQVEELKNIIKKYPVIGLLDLRNLPSKQFNELKRKLSDVFGIAVYKKVIMSRAIEELESEIKGIKKLGDYLPELNPALVFSEYDSFKLMKKVRANLSPAFAKAGQTAPEDLMIKKGPTPFAPGPISSEFGKIGVKAKVEGGKVSVIKDTVVAKKGEEINEDVAGMLSKLGMKPMKIGLNLIATYEKGTVFDKEVLIVDEEEFKQKLILANLRAFNLAMNSGVLTKETVEFLVQKAFNEAKSIALDCNIVSKEIIDTIISRAQGQALSLEKQVGGK